MKLTANVRTVIVKQFVQGASIAELAKSWPFQPTTIESVLRKRLRFHETNEKVFFSGAELPLNNSNES